MIKNITPMKTTHKIIFKNSQKMTAVPSESVDLIVTSPPYPMIKMWDDVFSSQNKAIGPALTQNFGAPAFELMHRELDQVWDEVYRVLKTGGIACINIGDAVRTINGSFSLFTNHSRIQTYMQKLGFSALPAVLWRKQTNAPNKFMGSGMMPPGAYVTLEHEYILIFRKGAKREFSRKSQKQLRYESSYFWEERNQWFSDIWMDLKGTTQNSHAPKVRSRSAAFPFELPYRLIAMFSIKGDTVLDPFLGIGTSIFAAMAAGRNSVGYEIDKNFQDSIVSKIDSIADFSNHRIRKRLENHCEFVENRYKTSGKFKHINQNYRFPVITRQETKLAFNDLLEVTLKKQNYFEVLYSDTLQEDFFGFREEYVLNQ